MKADKPSVDGTWVQFGTAESADFELGTWTFDMQHATGWKVAAGEFAILPAEEYRRFASAAAPAAQPATLREVLSDERIDKLWLYRTNLHGGDLTLQLRDFARALLAASSDEDRKLADRLKLEAQTHAQEARTANATIAEIYQLVTGATGEPGNWHGAEPVREYIAEQRMLMEQAADALQDASKLIAYLGRNPKLQDAAIAAIRSRLDGEKT